MRLGLLREKYLYFMCVAYGTSPYVAWLAWFLGLTPNQITLLGIALAVPAVVLLLHGFTGSAIVVFHLFFVCDCADGVLARGSNNRSVRGAYLDDLAHYIFHPAFFYAYAYALNQQGHGRVAFFMALFITLNLVMKAHGDLVGKLRLKNNIQGAAAGGGAPEGGAAYWCKSLFLGSFEFPNVLVWVTVLFWDLRLLEIYFIYACLMVALYLSYNMLRAGLATFAPAPTVGADSPVATAADECDDHD